MKKVYLQLLLCCLTFTNFAATWYSAPAGGDPSVLTNWWSNPAGTGANPANFTTATDVFTVQSNMVMTVAAWTVDGVVIMNSGSITLTPATNASITFNGTVTMNNSTHIWNGYSGGGGGGGPRGTVTLNFYAPLTMNDNSSIDGNPAVTGGVIDVELYSDLFMSGTSFFNNQSMSGAAYTFVYFANTASTLVSPQHLSGTGSQAGSYYTTFTINNGVFVQLVGNFNTEPYSVSMGNNNTFNVGCGAGFGCGAGVGTLDFQTYNFNGPGNIIVNNGSNIYTANDSGLNGSVLCTGTNTISNAASYVYNGTVPQVTGAMLAQTFTVSTGGFGSVAGTGKLTVVNPAGVTLSQNTTFTNGTILALTAGNLTIGANNVTMGSTANIVGLFSSTADIVTNGAGQLRKDFTANGSFTFPVGDAANYTPITINMTAPVAGDYAAGAYAGVTVTNSIDPHNANSNDYLARYWHIALSGITTPTYTITSAQYVVGDVVGTEANLSAGKYPNALPWTKYGAANTALHTLTTGATGITNLNADFSGITTLGPSFTITPSASNCSGVSSTLEVLSSTADAPATFTWSPGSGLSGTVGTTVAATPTVTTTYTATITDGNGFTNTQTTTLTVNPNPGPITGAGSGVLCLSQTLSLADAVSGGTWSSTDGSSATVDGSGNVTAEANGTPSIVYTLTGGCTATVTLDVVTEAAAISGPPTACTGATTSLSDIGAGSWSSSNTAQATIDPVSGVLTGVAPGNTVISYTLAPGCAASTSITVNESPAGITGPANACIGVTSDLAEATTGGIWSSNNTAFATVTATGGVTGVATGSATIYYSVPATGCFTAYPMGVVSLPPPIGGTPSVCAGFTQSLSDGIAGGTWTSGNTALAVINPSTGVVTGISPGTPSIIYTLLPGCFTAVPFTVNSSGTPTVAIAVSPATTVCPGTLAHFTTTSTTFSGGTPTFDWVKDGIYVSTGPTYSYVPVDGDIVYSVLHSDFTCRRIDTAISNHFTMSTVPVTTPVVTISSVYSTVGSGTDDTLIATITSATPTPLYQWYKNDHVIAGATNSFYVVNVDTNGSIAYNCVVNAGDACNTIGISNRLYINVTNVSVKQITADGSELNIAPNPSKGTFAMTLQSASNEPVQVLITNILGEKVKEFTATTNMVTNINLNAATGIYLLSATTTSGRYVARIVIN